MSAAKMPSAWQPFDYSHVPAGYDRCDWYRAEGGFEAGGKCVVRLPGDRNDGRKGAIMRVVTARICYVDIGGEVASYCVSALEHA